MTEIRESTYADTYVEDHTYEGASGEVIDLLMVIQEHKKALLPFVNAYVKLDGAYGSDKVQIEVDLVDLQTAFTVYKD